MFSHHSTTANPVNRVEKFIRRALAGLMVAFLFTGSIGLGQALGAGTPDFQIQMFSPQKFRIQPLVSGPVSAAILGGSGSQSLITRQHDGHTVVDAMVPVGATLRLQVGDRCLGLKMVDANHYQYWED